MSPLGQDTDSLLGTILVRSAAVPADAVARALDAQREGDARNLGDLLLADGACAPESVARALDAQSAWRDGDVPSAARAIVDAGAAHIAALADAVIEVAEGTTLEQTGSFKAFS